MSTNLTSPIPLSLYIHIPWCVKKCPYCDFNSHNLRDKLPESAYIDHLKQELTQKLSLIKNRCIKTVFIGGGTPSLISAEGFKRLLTYIHANSDLAKGAEITLEANPGTIDYQKFHAYRSIGINRLSLGIQSLQDQKLKVLGRIHDSNTALHAIDVARAAGFENLNIDLMFGLSQQTISEALQDLNQIVAKNPTHLSWYQLTLEPNTLFYKHPPQLPNEDELWEMQQAGQIFLEKNGYRQYEISAYSQTDRQCQHNLNYWLFGDYLGIGAGAHSKLTLHDGSVTRHSNIKHPKLYFNAVDKIATKKILEQKELPLEFMLNACRLSQTIPIKFFETRTGVKFSAIEKTMAIAEQENFITVDNNAFTVTRHGRGYLNNLLMLFMP